MLLIFSASCPVRETPSPVYPIATPIMPGFFPWPLLELSSCINKFSGSMFSPHEHSLHQGLPHSLVLLLLRSCFLSTEASHTPHFVHFTVNYCNILLLVPNTFPGIPPLSIPSTSAQGSDLKSSAACTLLALQSCTLSSPTNYLPFPLCRLRSHRVENNYMSFLISALLPAF